MAQIENLKKKKIHWDDFLAPKILLACAFVSILTTIGIVLTLVFESFTFFSHIPFWDYISGTEWSPLINPKSFGVLPLINGTLLIAFIAILVAIPLGLGSAIFLSEYASERVKNTIKPVLEILAGVPTIVYGYFALTFVTPVIRVFFPETGVFNALSAGIVVGIMITPLIASISEDAMEAVPRSLREGAYALGATKFEVATSVVVPAALSGIIASFVLAISRAVGETMATTLAAGATPKLTLNPLESVQTMTAYIVQVSLGDAPHGSVEYQTIFAVGMTLFVFTLAMNILAQYISRRFREEY